MLWYVFIRVNTYMKGKYMDFLTMNDKAILKELGSRIQCRRLSLNMTQLELTLRAGVARKVIQNIESGKSCTMKGFLRTLRALGLADGLDSFLPKVGLSPIQLAKLKGRERQRASTRSVVSIPQGRVQ